MKRPAARPKAAPRPKQQTSTELRNALLEFIQTKFYPAPEHWLTFQKDQPRLLAWVVLWPAKWLDERGVTLPAARYQELIVNALLEGLRHGDTANIAYLPAWLGRVVQSHFNHQEEVIYAEAKSLAPTLEQTLAGLAAVAAAARQPDPVREMATAAGLLKPAKKASAKPAGNGQLSLL